MDKNKNREESRLSHLGGISEIVNWALDNNERVIVVGQDPQRVFPKQGGVPAQVDFFQVNSVFGDRSAVREQMRG